MNSLNLHAGQCYINRCNASRPNTVEKEFKEDLVEIRSWNQQRNNSEDDTQVEISLLAIY